MTTQTLILNEILRQESSGQDALWVAGYRARLLHELTANGLPVANQSDQYQAGWQAGSVWLSTISVRVCPVCDSPVIGSASKVYCSDACRQRAYRERRQNG